MPQKLLLSGTAHKIPSDLHQALNANKSAATKWNDLTPLARNEWICWVTFVKKEETRIDHVKRTIIHLNEGKRRPCCWIGCPHRKDKPISPSIQSILEKRSKKL